MRETFLALAILGGVVAAAIVATGDSWTARAAAGVVLVLVVLWMLWPSGTRAAGVGTLVAPANEPPIAEPSPRPGLRCPHCDHAFHLTWSIYLAGRWNTYACPRCRTRSRMVLPSRLRLFERIVISITSLALAIAAIATSVATGTNPVLLLVAGVVTSVILCSPMNRALDDRYGHLERIDAGPSA